MLTPAKMNQFWPILLMGLLCAGIFSSPARSQEKPHTMSFFSFPMACDLARSIMKPRRLSPGCVIKAFISTIVTRSFQP